MRRSEKNIMMDLKIMGYSVRLKVWFEMMRPRVILSFWLL
jgi:hypothetical protein